MKISHILDKIDENQLFVPTFQREYVWKRKDAKNLIASLIKDYPTGTMLTWETNNPPELKGAYSYTPEKGSVKLILDGQQRITTLYMLMRGEIPPYYTENEIVYDIRNLYVNVETLELEYYKKIIMEKNPLWVNITAIFKRDINARDITDDLEYANNGERLPKHREDIIYNNIRTIENIENRDFLEQVIPVRATVKEAIDIFYIVNASGVNLTDAELALAQISGYWPQARQLFKTKLDELKERGWVFNLDFIVYALLALTHNNGSKMEKLHSPENKEKVMKAWERLEHSLLDYTVNILQSQAYVDHTKEINSIYALVPILAYIYKKADGKLNEEEIKKVIRWFYYSQIRARYVSQLPAKLDKDLTIVAESEDPFTELLALIAEERSLEIKASEFVGRGIQHPLYGLMKWYFKSQNAVCLGTGLTLRKNMGKAYELENDHIFPYSVLRDSEYFDMNNRFDYALAQEISNRAILTKVENRSKSAKFADVYLHEVKRKYPNALALQCIPEDEELWKVENYEAFLEKRRSLLAEKLNHYLKNISVNHQEVKVTRNISDIIESGESMHLEFKSTLRWDMRNNKVNKKLEEVILKTVSAFANAEGGSLLIGVQDDGEILGLDYDYATFREGNKDTLELHFRNLINDNFGKQFAMTNLKVSFPVIDDKEICKIDIKQSGRPLFLVSTDKNGAKQKKFYVRSGNSSQELEIDEVASYIKSRFELIPV